MLTLLFDGIAYGMLLFVLAVGLAVTLGLMNFINLAHGAFAMAGGYVTVLLMERAGVPFLATLPLAFLVPALVGGVAERLLYRPMYHRPHLDHVLFSIGLVFMAVTAIDYFIGPQQQIAMGPGDLLALITDGFFEWARTDAAGQREQFGLERLRESIRRYAHLPASGLVEGLAADAAAFAGGEPQQDDLTALAQKLAQAVVDKGLLGNRIDVWNKIE